MKFLIGLLVVLSSSVVFAQGEVVYCQFWNSLTHTPEGITLKAEFTADKTHVEKCFAQNSLTETLHSCMIFERANLASGSASKFIVTLDSMDSLGVHSLGHYERDLSKQKIENFVLTGSSSMGNHMAALCSPQN